MTNIIERLAGKYIDAAPQVSSAADKIIEDSKPPEDETPYTPSETGSELRVNFNPEIHATDEAGNPIRNKDGSFRKKRGRKKKAVQEISDEQLQELQQRRYAENMGRATAEMIFALGQGLFGEEWKPVVDPKKGINEPESMRDAYAAFYEQQGISEVPPWIGLVIATLSYALPRLQQPKTKGRIATWIERWKARKK